MPLDPETFTKGCTLPWCSAETPCLPCRQANGLIIHPPFWAPTELKPYPDPIPKVIPFGTVTLLAGAPGVGKTAMLAEWIRRWLDGRTIWGHPTNRPTEFCYLAADRQWASHQQWFDAVGYSEIKYYSVADDPGIDLNRLTQPSNSFKIFQESIEKLNPKPGAHVIVDPMAPLFIAGDQNRPRDVAVTLIRFSKVCKARQINLTCCAHFSKQKTDSQTQYRRPMDRISGSGALVGFSDTQIYLIDPEPPEQPYHIFGWRPRHSKEENFKVIRGDDGLFKPYDDLLGPGSFLLEMLPEGRSVQISELEEAAFESLGMSRATLYRRLKELEDVGLISRERGRVVKVRIQ